VRLPAGDPISDAVDQSAQVIVALGPTGLAAPDDGAGATGATGLDEPDADAAAPAGDAAAPAEVTTTE
jgi:hypothetical protein